MKFIPIILSLTAVTCLNQCTSKDGSLGLEKTTSATLDAVIKRHVTTANDIKAYLGPPLRTEYTSFGYEKWIYVYRRTDIKARTLIPIANLFSSEIDTSEKTLVITFNEYKKVIDYTVSESLRANKSGILEHNTSGI